MKEKVLLLAIAAILCIAAVLGFVFLPVEPAGATAARQDATLTSLMLTPTPKPTAVAPTPTPTSPLITITIEGSVQKPGKYTLPRGATVRDALRAAGGITKKADILSIDLNRVLQDKEVLKIDDYSSGEWKWIRESDEPQNEMSKAPR